MALRTGSLQAFDLIENSSPLFQLENSGRNIGGISNLKCQYSVRKFYLNCKCSKQDGGNVSEVIDKDDAEKTLEMEFKSVQTKGPTVKSSLALLDQYAAASEDTRAIDLPSSQILSIAKQLENQILGYEDMEEVTIPLGKKFKKPDLTISQKRNIRRQAYLNTVSKRNDSSFFLSVGLLVLLPPIVILGIAVAVGYVDILP